MTAPDASAAPPPLLFDPALRIARRERAARSFPAHDFLHSHMVEGLLERLADVQRPLRDALVIGCPDDRARTALEALGKRVTCLDPAPLLARRAAGHAAHEDALPFAPESFDLILACGTLDTVNDLPGALLLMRRALRADGLMLAAMIGAPSLPRLRAALLHAEGDRPQARIHPQIELRAAGDLLARTGYALPVADIETLDVRYSSLFGLLGDLRGMGASNIMSARGGPLTRAALARAADHFAAAAEPDGKTRERFSLLYLSGWRPDPSQPQPAKRGSATASLAAALRSRA